MIVTLEDGILDGGFGEKIARFYGRSHQKVLNYGLQKKFLDRYDVAEVLRQTPDGGADCRRCGRAAVQRKQVRS